jgi:S1-C subfamily serine protease
MIVITTPAAITSHCVWYGPLKRNNVVATTPVGREVPLSVVRDGKSMQLTVKVGQQAESKEAAAGPEKVPAKLGLTVEPVTLQLAQEMGLRDKQGVIVRSVESDSPAAEAGIREGDVIVEVNRHAIQNAGDLKHQLDGHAKGTRTDARHRERQPVRGRHRLIPSPRRIGDPRARWRGSIRPGLPGVAIAAG